MEIKNRAPGVNMPGAESENISYRMRQRPREKRFSLPVRPPATPPRFAVSLSRLFGGSKKIIKHALGIIIAAVILSGLLAYAAEAKNLVPVGRAVGIRLDSAGVVVVGVPEKCADNTTPSPAHRAGIRAGDIIVRVGSAAISSGEELRAATANLNGVPVALHVLRGGETVQINVTPAILGDGGGTLGLWVRDGISGIGTVTFYDPESGMFGALGHSVNDTDTGVRLPLRGGIIAGASVNGVQRGKSGTPGQLHGTLSFDHQLGTIQINSDCGIFGCASRPFPGEAIETAAEHEIHVGPAYILSNVTGTDVCRYEAEISRVYTGGEAGGRTMLVTIRDDALTGVTGGIVQGMSGSPIIQDGKLIGAITHVMVSDPTKGYGVSIEKMLSIAGAAAA